MAGKNIILENGQMLFKGGDPSNGMYLVRQGELRVFLAEDNGSELTLATVSDGGMIGEMALFDQKPRSASVKATKKTEVTHITHEDFQKLMKQIPKWFTALMGTLSSRLRATNERLQKIESKSMPARQKMEAARRLLHVLDLVFHRDGVKEGKEWTLEKKRATEAVSNMFPDDSAVFEKTLATLCQENFLTLKKNSYKGEIIVPPNRAALAAFVKFFDHYSKAAPEAALSQPAFDLLSCLAQAAEMGAYESLAASLSELEVHGQKARMTSMKLWKDVLGEIGMIHQGEIQVVKGSEGPGLRCKKAEIKGIVRHHAVLRALNTVLSS